MARLCLAPNARAWIAVQFVCCGLLFVLACVHANETPTTRIMPGEGMATDAEALPLWSGAPDISIAGEGKEPHQFQLRGAHSAVQHRHRGAGVQEREGIIEKVQELVSKGIDSSTRPRVHSGSDPNRPPAAENIPVPVRLLAEEGASPAKAVGGNDRSGSGASAKADKGVGAAGDAEGGNNRSGGGGASAKADKGEGAAGHEGSGGPSLLTSILKPLGGLSKRQQQMRRLREIAQAVHRNGTVMVTSCNKGYIRMLENWVLSLVPFNLHRHFMVFAEDEETLQFSLKRWPNHVLQFEVTEEDGVALFPDAHDAWDWKSKVAWNFMVRRPIYLRTILRLNYSVLFSDNDIVLLRDPFAFLPPAIPYHMAFVADGWVWGAEGEQWGRTVVPLFDKLQPEKGESHDFEPCGCFQFWSPTPDSMEVMDRWIQSLAHGQNGNPHDQAHLATLFHSIAQNRQNCLWRSDCSAVSGLELNYSVALLPPALFPAGRQAFRGFTLRADKDDVVLLHPNDVPGFKNKRGCMREAGVWRVDGMQPGEWEEVMRTGTSVRLMGGGGWKEGGEVDRVDVDAIDRGMGEFIAAAKKHAVNSTLMLTIVNPEEELLFLNWLASLRKIGMENAFVAVTSNETVAEALSSHWGDHIVLQPLHSSFPPNTSLPESLPSSHMARHAWWRMPFLLHELLAVNIVAVVSPPSAVWLSLPAPPSPPHAMFLRKDLSSISLRVNVEEESEPRRVLRSEAVGHVSPLVFILYPSNFAQAFVEKWVWLVARTRVTSAAFFFCAMHMNHAMAMAWNSEDANADVNVSFLPKSVVLTKRLYMAAPKHARMLSFSEVRNETSVVLVDEKMDVKEISAMMEEEALWSAEELLHTVTTKGN